jgi:hypothetical protein
MATTKPKTVEEILSQEIPIEKIYVRKGTSKPNKFNRYRCLAYVEWPTLRALLDEADPGWTVEATQTSLGDLPHTEQTKWGPTTINPDAHFFAVRTLTVAGISRSGTGEDDRSPKAAATDACKRAAYQFGVAQQLFSDEWYRKVGLPGMQFFCEWPDEYATHVSLKEILNGARGRYKPGDYKGSASPQKPQKQQALAKDEKEEAIKMAMVGMKHLGLAAEDVTAFIEAKYEGKHSSKDLSLDEAKDLRDTLMQCETREGFGRILGQLILRKAGAGVA